MGDEWEICERCIEKPYGGSDSEDRLPHMMHINCSTTGFTSKINNYTCPGCGKRPPNNLIIIAELLYLRI